MAKKKSKKSMSNYRLLRQSKEDGEGLMKALHQEGFFVEPPHPHQKEVQFNGQSWEHKDISLIIRPHPPHYHKYNEKKTSH